MLAKKNPFGKINLLIGFICSLGLVLIAFEWNTSEIVTPRPYDSNEVVYMAEDVLPITYQQKQVRVQPPSPNYFEALDIVEDEVVLEDPLDIIDETDEYTPFKEVDLTDFGETTDVAEEVTFVAVQNMPEFPGGKDALMAYLSKNVKYPRLAMDHGVDGTVVVRFVVWKDGSIRNVEVVKGVHPDLDKEAVRVITNMPTWKPGRQQGSNVSVYFTIPVRFVLN